MSAWPETLPAAPLLDSLRETVTDNLLRTEMDQGPAKLRRRSSSIMRRLMLSYLLDGAQTATMDAFYSDTLSGGSASFDFTHPRTGGTITCRFKKPPEYAPAGKGCFRAALELEILP